MSGRTTTGVLAVTETVSWGIVYYGFTQFVPEMQALLHTSRAVIAGAFSLALATQAAAAPVVGRLFDRYNPRWLLSIGAVGNTLGVLAWSQVTSVAGFYAVWAWLGISMSLTLYDAAFTVVAKWFDGAARRRALTAVTLLAGLASFIFLPIEAALAEAHGVRQALVILAIALGAITVPLHAFGVSRPPQATVPRAARTRVTSSSTFRYLAAAAVGSSFVASGLAIHQVSYFREHGFTAKAAAGLTGILGAMQLVGRLGFAPLMRWAPRRIVTTIVYALSAATLGMLAATSNRNVIWVFVVAYGSARGMITLLRATLVVELFGPERFGAVSGTVSGLSGAAQATAPLAVGLLYDQFHGYGPLLWMLFVVALAAALCAHRIERVARTE